ncbi:hypothetical protein LZP69_16360, partial [Shewanella sp. AS1]|uniref:hypothetical protein n=1 Tax=Shewanella sp. AS1 TaxID=2907626 RepID=UPI001F3867E8
MVKVTTGGRLQAEGITFRHAGSLAGDVIVAGAGELELTECCLTGALTSARAESDGNGLVIAAAATARVIRCRVEYNAASGIR